MNQAATQQTLDLIRKAQMSGMPMDPELAKAWTQSATATSGITAYDLEAPAKNLYPVLTPLRNIIPRVSGRGGIQANWRAITGINTTMVAAGVGQGNRGGIVTTTTADYLAAYRTLGHEDNVTFEAELAAEGFQDLRATAVENLLKAVMISEEAVILGGNSSRLLGTTPTPVLVGAGSGGTIPDQTESVICVALTPDGFRTASIAGGVLGAVARTNADGSTDNYGGGSAAKSAAATVVLSGGGDNAFTATVTAVRGAAGYAWYYGTAGNELLGAITTINSVSVTAPAAGTQNASALSGDNSRNTLIHDGILNFIYESTNNSYFKTMATGTAGVGTPLTADSKGGIVEIDEALKSFWDNYRLSPDTIWVNSQEQKNITDKILTTSTSGANRVVVNVGSNAQQGTLAGGYLVRSYLNKFSMAGAIEIPIMLHPNMPAGTIMFTCRQLPYPLSNVVNVLQIKARRDYYQLEWPLRTRKYEYGVYSDQVLQNYFPPAFGAIVNIGNG